MIEVLGRVAPVVQHLPSKQEALRLTPSTARGDKVLFSLTCVWLIRGQQSGLTVNCNFNNIELGHKSYYSQIFSTQIKKMLEEQNS
jgi:hypothetical protein